MFIFNRLRDAIALRNRVSELERQNKDLLRWRRWFELRMERLEKRMSDQQTQIDELTKMVNAQNEVIGAQGEVIGTQGEMLASQGETIAKVQSEVEALIDENPDVDLSNLTQALADGQSKTDANTAKLQENTAKLVANSDKLKALDDMNPDAPAPAG